MTRWLIRAWLAAMAAGTALSAGCFYDGGINQPPVARIELRGRTADDPLFVGTRVELSAAGSSDPDGDGLSFEWIARLCDDEGDDCDGPAFDTGNRSTFELELDSKGRVLVELFVTDKNDALAHTARDLFVVNRAPNVEPLEDRIRGLPDPRTGAFTVGREIEITAVASDPDGDPITFEWGPPVPPKNSSPNQAIFEVAEQADEQSVLRFVPDVPGIWQVEVTVRDDDGGETPEVAIIPIAVDAPPCVSLVAPRAIADAPYIIFSDAEPREFSVLRVVDELDPFPAAVEPQADDVGATEFRWLVGGPGLEFEVVSEGPASSFAVDPRDYAPGDIIDVRVEALDRVERVLPCADEQATCSIGGDPACLQRLTWKAEIR